MQACKDKAAVSVPRCKCHLCQKTVFKPPHRTRNPYYIDGKFINADEMENSPKPTIFCPFLEMFKSQYFPCCCVTHKEPRDCKINGGVANICECPRCCRHCMKDLVMLSDGTKKDCDICQLKCRYYTPCKHLRGFCDT